MPDYSFSKIYKITSPHTDKIYIGSTTQPLLSKRLAQHVWDYNRHLNGKYHYTSSFDIIKLGDYRIELIKAYNLSCKDALYQKETKWINKLNCVNKCKTYTGIEFGLDRKEYCKIYYESNNKQIKEKKKDHYERNKEVINERNNKYGSKRVTCDICQKEMRRDSITRHKKNIHKE